VHRVPWIPEEVSLGKQSNTNEMKVVKIRSKARSKAQGTVASDWLASEMMSEIGLLVAPALAAAACPAVTTPTSKLLSPMLPPACRTIPSGTSVKSLFVHAVLLLLIAFLKPTRAKLRVSNFPMEKNKG
jgi:hypothetical protein